MDIRISNIFTREEMAQYLSATITGNVMEGMPYMPNGENDHWSLDAANNWWVTFFEDDPQHVRITYRYQGDSNLAEEALMGWLSLRLKTIVEDDEGE